MKPVAYIPNYVVITCLINMELLILPFSVMRYASEKYCFTLLSIKNFLNAFIGNLFLYNCCRKEDPFQRTRLSSYLTLRNEL